MNAAHIHLVLNHFPIIGMIFSVVLVLTGRARRNPELARAGVMTMVITALIAIAVYLTGEPAEEIVEHLAGRSEDIIELHETAGLVSLISLEVLGAFSFLGLIAYRRPSVMPNGFLLTLLLLGLAVGTWVGWTSHLGGQISHEETRPDFNAPSVTIGEDDS